MDGGPRRQLLGGSLSTGQLMRLSSQLCERDDGLLSLGAVERMRDPVPYTYAGLGAQASVGVGAVSTGSSWLKPFNSTSSSGPNSTLASKASRLVSTEPLLARDAQGITKHGRGFLSCTAVTERENASLAKLDASQAMQGRKGVKPEPGSLQADAAVPESPAGTQRQIEIETSAVDFNEEVAAMENQIADIGKKMRCSDGNNAEARKHEEREEEKRRREQELRKARLKEKNARDPHRKVQMKIENKRRFEMDTLDKAGIPTQLHTFEGAHGKEQMSLVDVTALRSRCQGLSQGIHSVSKLVELQQRKESYQSNQASTYGPPSLMMSSSMPTLGTLNKPSDKTSVQWKDRSFQKTR